MKSAILFAAAWIICATGVQAEERELESNLYGNLYGATVTSEAIANAPAWDTNDDPPLSTKQATQIAKREATRMTKGLEGLNWRLNHWVANSRSNSLVWSVSGTPAIRASEPQCRLIQGTPVPAICHCVCSW